MGGDRAVAGEAGEHERSDEVTHAVAVTPHRWGRLNEGAHD